MWRAPRVVVAAGLALALALTLPHGAATRTDSQRPPAQITAGHQVTFALALRLRARRLDGYLNALYSPGTRSYGRYVSATAFGHRFGISAAALRALRRTLARVGVTVVGIYPQRTAVDVSSPAAVVERLFGTRLVRLGRDGIAFSGRPTIPGTLRRFVTAVAGLGDTAAALPDDVPTQGLRPADAAAAYDIAPLARLGLSGQGETVAIISFAGYSQADLDQFTRAFGLPPLRPQAISVDGGTTDTNPSDESEVELDMEVVHEIAPQAQILDYNAPRNTSSGGDALGDIVDRIVADGRARIVSDSWGTCELLTATSDIQRDEVAIQAAVAHGISIFKSAGDAGAYECQRADPRNNRLSVEWPTSSPGVVAVGGTSLSVGPGGIYAGETTWQDPLEQSGGGGGLSVYFRRPSWQSAPGVINAHSNGARQLPDVAGDADVATGWATYTGGSAGITGGTSAASPFWAAAIALIDEDVRHHGLHALGFVDPMLYAIASTPQAAPPFHDITVGTNRYYPATPGWDFATGLGSPNVTNLARDVLQYLQHSHG